MARRPPALTSEQRLQRHGHATPAKGARRGIENLIVIGASAGGHPVLLDILKDLPVGTPAAIVILIHRPLGGTTDLKAVLQRSSHLPIIDVEDDTPLKHGAIFIPSPGRSAMFSDRGISVGPEISKQPLVTINSTFESAVQRYGERVIGVILSGLLSDGTEGIRAIYEAGGVTLVQDPEEAEFPDMPVNAMAKLPVTFCLKSKDIGPALELLVRRTARFETGLAVAVRMLRDRAALLVRLGEQSWRNPGTHRFLTKELASLRRNLRAIDDLVKVSLGEDAE